MKLSLSVLADEFPEHDCELICGAPAGCEYITGIWMLPESCTECQPERLYVCTAEEYERESGRPGLRNAAVAGKRKGESMPVRGRNILRIAEKYGTAEIYDALRECKDRFDRWEERISEKIRGGRSLQEIFDEAGTVLNNPAALFDRTSVLILKTGNIPPHSHPSVWDAVLADSHFPPGEHTVPPTHWVYETMMKNEKPAVYHSETHDEEQISCGLFVKGTYYGLIGSVGFQPFTPGQIALYWEVKKKMEWALTERLQETGTRGSAPWFITQLLAGIRMEESLVHFQLQKVGWQYGVSYRLIVIQKGSSLIGENEDAVMEWEESQKYFRSLEMLFPRSILFYYEGNLVCITPVSGNDGDHEWWERLSETLGRLGLQAGISLTYPDFMQLRLAWKQACRALKIGQKDTVVSSYKDNYRRVLIEILRAADEPESLCHPVLLKYAEEGGDKNLEFIRTLGVYLECGRNIAETGRRLYLHRNTVSYRIEKMSRILGTDLTSDRADPGLIQMLKITCMILTAEEPGRERRARNS